MPWNPSAPSEWAEECAGLAKACDDHNLAHIGDALRAAAVAFADFAHERSDLQTRLCEARACAEEAEAALESLENVDYVDLVEIFTELGFRGSLADMAVDLRLAIANGTVGRTSKVGE